MAEKNVVVLGAGVIGLTTAMLLAKDKTYNVTLLAKHHPGDSDISYCSPWAGANYLPVGKAGSDLAKYEKDTWAELARLATDVLEAGVHFQETVLVNREKDKGTSVGSWFEDLMKADPWYKDVVPNFRILGKEELPKDVGADSGAAFTSVCINTAIYLPWLAGQCLARGVKLQRFVASHINDVVKNHHTGQPADVIINCTGLSSLTLGGVEDKKLYPARGQIVLVRNDPKIMTSVSGTDDGDDEATYTMHRAGGGGTILGGCLQKGNWDAEPDMELATRIMKRCVALTPALTNGQSYENLDVIRHGVGLRPMREGGPRVELEVIDGVPVVHQYGHGGYGYQSSYGSAYRAIDLVTEAVRGRE